MAISGARMHALALDAREARISGRGFAGFVANRVATAGLPSSKTEESLAFIWAWSEEMTARKAIGLSGWSLTDASARLAVPYRTVQNWMAAGDERRDPPGWASRLIAAEVWNSLFDPVADGGSL